MLSSQKRKSAIARGRQRAQNFENYPASGRIGLLEVQFTEGLAMADEYFSRGSLLRGVLNLFNVYTHIISQGNREFSSRYLTEIRRRLKKLRPNSSKILSCGDEEDGADLLSGIDRLVERTLQRYTAGNSYE